jgi:signal transduction histidine kinase
MKLKLKHKIAAVALLAAILPMLVISVLSLIQRDHASKLINDAIHEMIVEDLTHVMRDFYSLCKTANDFTQQYVNHSLNIAHEKLYQKGPIKLSSEEVKWVAENQFTREESPISLPKMNYGNHWMGKNSKIKIGSIVVDDVENLLGATCTIFQRMNEKGDMLRVVTNVKKLDQSRAIGTYIPAANPDGTKNDVVSTVINGEIFHGRAYVVNDWYLTAYEPIYDSRKKIIGMLYVGVKQESAESFRESILQTKIGNTGYLFAIGGNGVHKGEYLISKSGKRDGKSVWQQKDINGDFIFQNLIKQSLTLRDGKIEQLVYSESQQKNIIIMYTYFEPWDWVIGANAYEEDYREAKDKVDEVISDLVLQTLWIGLLILILVTILAFYLSARIAKPLNQITESVEILAAGNLSQKIKYTKEDEIGILAKSYNKMSAEIHGQRQQLQATNKQLEEANSTKDKFFSIIAHDLKNPFNTLMTYSSTLLKQYKNLDEDKLKRGLEALHNNSKRGYNLLVDLLTWARSQSGNMEFEFDTINLYDIANDNVSLLKERAKDKGIKLFSEIDDNISAYADKNMVSTVIRNLMTNAVKFTSSGGEIKISAEKIKSMVQVTISDTGMGISEENINKLFRINTFYRTLGTDKEKGTGLGLILCQEFIEKLDGKIWVESELGKGSKFIFTLPESNKH